MALLCPRRDEFARFCNIGRTIIDEETNQHIGIETNHVLPLK